MGNVIFFVFKCVLKVIVFGPHLKPFRSDNSCYRNVCHDEIFCFSEDREIPTEDSGSCFPLFNATFDQGIQDDSPFQFSVGREPWQSISVESVSGANGGAARAKNGRMPLWFTGGNDLGGKLQIQFRFMVNKGSVPDTVDIVLLSNPQCSGGPMTVSISYRPADQRYSVFFRDTQVARTIRCNHRGPVS